MSRRPAVRPTAHWIALSAVVLFLVAVLVVQGYVQHLGGSAADGAAQPGSAAAVPSAVAHGGPVVATRKGLRTLAPPSRTVALTFDDGPDPRWTPEILKVLSAYGAHATFFQIGQQAIAHPDLARAVVAAGSEVGVHTLTHVNLGSAPTWRQQLELTAGEQALIDATGSTTGLFRPPYSSTNAALGDAGWQAIRAAGADGLVTVLTTQDSEDWRRPGVDAILHNATPQGDAGQVLLMHDGGGDRSETVAALKRLLPALAARGIRVTTVSDAFGLAQTSRPATFGERAAAAVTAGAVRVSDGVVVAVEIALLISGILVLLRSVLVVIVAARHVRLSRRRPGRPVGRARTTAVAHTVTDPVTVIVPAYNEAAGIEAAVRSIAASTHPVEVIVVDDGSTDDTAGIVERLGLDGVRVLRRSNGGKPAALNTGIAAASHELIVMVDGDTVFEPDTVARLVQSFADPAVGAISGNTKVVNRGGVLGRWQHIEYVVGFNLDRRLFDLAECMPTVPGAIGAFRRSALAGVGGVSDDTLAEDTDLTMAILRDGWRVVYREDARAWTEVPADLGALWKQRYRWCYGTLQAMWKHRGAVLQGGSAGRLGRRGLTYLLLLQVLLPLLAPVVDVFALYGILFLDPVRVLGLWLFFLVVQTAVAAYAFRLDGERIGPLWTLPLQQIVYRQLMYLVVIQSVFTAIAGRRLRWQRMQRYGTLPMADEGPASAAPADPASASARRAG
ncbi:bifunctional polysaccharide deacetylase/glycosyltransferase family 2 protein [Microbacterium capsulatum]|uniref:Bifunctional polysaccharide deacetylase/glycosyltransferase family 2 protein n=1 Tax=Microbacterium capsulatum TaxID=3041921 RepID=A0ABU0XG30_9MICO|nr:bifunctional polysaccharide deacetylase/glycosyltransferase family 2 protein [Microbacterium sp. ASV81]MDQ4214082.1 bifunctional polysaccharide deacetylase/glycosyltransferase family 2 protein [Microbacterium sp. ASV81]